MNRNTLESPHHYVEPDDHYLHPMTRSQRAKKAKKVSSKVKGSKMVRESETYEDVDVQSDDYVVPSNDTDDDKTIRKSKKYESVKF